MLGRGRSTARWCWRITSLRAGGGVAQAGSVSRVTGNGRWQAGATVKWPNDIYLRGRKCAGILAEARSDFVVVGVGLNVFSAPAAAECDTPAIALGDVVAEAPGREQVLAAVLDGIMREVECCGSGFLGQVRRLREVCYLAGKTIGFNAGGRQHCGTVSGIAEDGSLLVVVDGVEVAYPQAAEIRVIRE